MISMDGVHLHFFTPLWLFRGWNERLEDLSVVWEKNGCMEFDIEAGFALVLSAPISTSPLQWGSTEGLAVSVMSSLVVVAQV